jgi:hypothetical protein
MKTSGWNIAIALALGTGGCAHAPRSVSDPDPADKIPAIEIAVKRNDKSVIPQLVKDLDNDDPAIRFYAIDGLHSLAGEDFGYRFFDEAEARKPAVEKWNQWLAGHHP